jgi:hypothetical protein
MLEISLEKKNYSNIFMFHFQIRFRSVSDLKHKTVHYLLQIQENRMFLKKKICRSAKINKNTIQIWYKKLIEKGVRSVTNMKVKQKVKLFLCYFLGFLDYFSNDPRKTLHL